MQDARILIVEDDPLVAQDLRTHLEFLKYTVVGITGSGSEAVMLAGELRPDLVLMDILLEGDIDGIQAAAAISEDYDIPVIYITAYVDEDYLERAKITDPLGYILKPYTQRELHAVITLALYRAEKERSLKTFIWGSNVCDNIRDAVIAVDSDLNISLLNPQAADLLAIDPDALQGKPWNEDVLGLTSLQALHIKTRLRAAAAEGKYWEEPKAIALELGARRVDLMVSVVPVFRRRRHLLGAMLILRDVTAHLQAERAVQTQNTRMSQYLDVCGAMMVALDLNGTITSVNPSACAVLGCSEAELLGRDWFNSAIPMRLQADARGLFERILQDSGEYPSEMEARVVTRSGEERLILWNLAPLRDTEGRVIGGLGSGVDVTERKRLEIAAERSRDFHLSLLQHLPILVWRADQTGRCDYFNETWLNFTGNTLQESIGDGWLEAIHPDDVDRVTAMYRQSVDRREAFVLTYRLRNKSGEYRAMIDNAQPIYDPNGDYSGYIGGCVDVEAERRAERDLRSLGRALKVLSQANETLVRADSNADLLQSICNIAVASGGYRMAWVGLAEHDKHRTVRPVAAAGISPEALAEWSIRWSDDEYGQGPTGRAIRSNQPGIMREPNEAFYKPWRDYAEQYDYASSVALPLHLGSEVVGALNIYAREPDAFDEDELRLLVNLAEDLSFGLSVQHKQKALHDLTLRNEIILRAVREGFLVLSLDNEIVDVNEAFCLQTGYSRQEILTMRVTDMVAESRREDTELHLGIVRQQGYDCFETQMQNKSGEVVSIELSATLADENDNAFIFVFLRDVSSRKRAEKALLESETKYRALFEVANDAIFLMQDDLFVDCNERTLTMFGCTREQIIGKPPYKFSPERQPDGRASKDKARDFISKAFAGEPMFFEWQHCRHDGQAFDAEVSLNRVRISGSAYLQAIVRDVTDRKAAERALAEANHYLSALYQASPDMIFLYASDGYLVDVNQNALDTYGYARDEMIELTIGDLSASDYSREQALRLVRRVLAGEDLDLEWMTRRKDGTEFPVEVRLRRLYQESTTMKAALVAVVRDLSAVKRVQAELQAILDFSPALISIKNLKGRVTLANRQFGVFSEKGSTDLIGKSVYDLFPRDVADAIWESDQRAIVSGKTVQVEESMRHVDGSEHTYLTVKFPLMSTASSKPFAVGAISTDITERNQAEKIIKQERDFTEAVLNTIGSVVVVLDRHGVVVRFNDAAQWLTGYTEAEMLGKHVWDHLLVPEQIESVKAVFADLTKGSVANQYVNYWVTKDGGKKLLDWNNTILTDAHGGVEFVIATGIDITEKLLAQEDLAKVEMQWNHAIDFFSEPLYFVDLQDRVLRANAAFYKLTGLSPEQAIGRNITEIMHPEGEAVPCPVCAARRARQDALIVMEADHPDNPIGKPVEIAVRMIRSRADAEPTGILLSLRDLTRQREIEEEIRRHRDNLEELVQERTQELEVVNRELEAFSYSVSHDLRAPLRSVDGFSQVLTEEYSQTLDERGRDYLRRVRTASKRMGQLIDDLLMLSRVSRQELHRQTIDLGAMAGTVLDALQAREPKRKVDVRIQSGLSASADVRLTRILLENLLGNAWKFTSQSEKAEIEVGKCMDQGQEVYFIRDNGVGFDMGLADRMFNAFQRLHSEQDFEGTGVGLATVQRIVHRHGGRIYARGEIGRGATLYFTLPVA